MEKVADDIKLNYYISKYKIDEIFNFNVRPFMELFFFNKNEHICKSEEKIDYLFFFVEGKAKVYTTLSNGKSLLLCFYTPFKIIGDVEFIDLETANSNIQVIEETYCIGIQFKYIRKFALDNAKFLKIMCASLGEKLVNLSKYSSINLLYPLENRLSSYILAVTHSGENKVIFNSSLSEVSELLGTSYRHLMRTLNGLCIKGAIRRHNHNYEIVSRDILKSMAGDLYE